MSKIYEALRRHENATTRLEDQTVVARSPLVRAIESIYPIVYRLTKEAGHGLVLHFVAASPGEGTSTLSAEFARGASRVADSQVLLLDADRLKLTTATNFNCPTDIGIVEQDLPLERKVVTSEQLHVAALAGRTSPPLSRKAMPLLYDQFRAKYDLTIIDCPAVFTDRYFELSPEATDGVVLIVQAERSRPEIIRQAQSLIVNAGGKFIGAVLNRRRTYIPDFLYRLL
jgi:protein-tyrosine kinase